jgi:hypothetical protein
MLPTLAKSSGPEHDDRWSCVRRYRWHAGCILLIVIVVIQLGMWTMCTQCPLAPPTIDAHTSSIVDIDPVLLARARSVCDPVSHECHRRLSWSELGALLDAHTPQYISRLKDAQAIYAASRLRMAQEYHTVSDAVRHAKFGAPCVMEDGKRRCAFGPGMSANDIAAQVDSTALPDSVVVPNDFPYALEAPMRHEVIWTRVPLHGDTTRVRRLIEHHFPSSQYRTMHLVNPPYLQTIKDIFHIHVFVGPSSSTSEPRVWNESLTSTSRSSVSTVDLSS